MWAVRAFVVKTLSGQTDTHTHTLWTLVIFHHALMLWDEVSGLAGEPGPATVSDALLFLCFCPPLSHTHSHWVILFSSYSHALASFLSRAGSIPQTKFNLANLQRRVNCLQIHHCEQKPVCSRQTGVCSLHDVQVRWANFGVVLWRTKMEVKNFRAQMMHMRKCIPSRDLVIKLRGTRVIVNKAVL